MGAAATQINIAARLRLATSVRTERAESGFNVARQVRRGIWSDLVKLGTFAVESVLTLSDAKARFSEIVERVVNGDEFVVTRMGKPVVRISRVATNAEPRKLGDLAGQIWMSEDFDDWPPDLRDALGMTGPR